MCWKKKKRDQTIYLSGVFKQTCSRRMWLFGEDLNHRDRSGHQPVCVSATPANVCVSQSSDLPLLCHNQPGIITSLYERLALSQIKEESLHVREAKCHHNGHSGGHRGGRGGFEGPEEDRDGDEEGAYLLCMDTTQTRNRYNNSDSKPAPVSLIWATKIISGKKKTPQVRTYSKLERSKGRSPPRGRGSGCQQRGREMGTENKPASNHRKC